MVDSQISHFKQFASHFFPTDMYNTACTNSQQVLTMTENRSAAYTADNATVVCIIVPSFVAGDHSGTAIIPAAVVRVTVLWLTMLINDRIEDREER